MILIAKYTDVSAKWLLSWSLKRDFLGSDASGAFAG